MLLRSGAGLQQISIDSCCCRASCGPRKFWPDCKDVQHTCFLCRAPSGDRAAHHVDTTSRPDHSPDVVAAAPADVIAHRRCPPTMTTSDADAGRAIDSVRLCSVELTIGKSKTVSILNFCKSCWQFSLVMTQNGYLHSHS